MRTLVELREAPPPAVLDGALGLALATGSALRVTGPLLGADLEVGVEPSSIVTKPISLKPA